MNSQLRKVLCCVVLFSVLVQADPDPKTRQEFSLCESLM